MPMSWHLPGATGKPSGVGHSIRQATKKRGLGKPETIKKQVRQSPPTEKLKTCLFPQRFVAIEDSKLTRTYIGKLKT